MKPNGPTMKLLRSHYKALMKEQWSPSGAAMLAQRTHSETH